MSLEPSFSINWVDLVQGSFTAKVARTRATYTITPRMFVSGIVQYNSAGTSFGSNVRFRWEYRPGSELFVVYTDDYNTEELRPDVTSLRNRALRDQIQPAVPSLKGTCTFFGRNYAIRKMCSPLTSFLRLVIINR